MTEWLSKLLDPSSLVIEGIYNLSFEIIATWITYKFLFKPMITKQVKKELENDKQD